MLLLCFCGQLFGQRPQITLDGTWQFQTDPARIGLKQGWHKDPRPLADRIEVPGCWQAQGVGEPREYLRHDYVGVAWYKRTVQIPTQWKGKLVWLKFGGASRRVEVFINGTSSGIHDGFSSPFVFDITPALRFGEENVIAIAVDNAGGSSQHLPLKEMDFSRPFGAFNFLGNWGGLYSHVVLEATENAWIDNVYVRTRLDPREALLQLTIAIVHDFPVTPLRVKVSIRPKKGNGLSYTALAAVTPQPKRPYVQTIPVPLDGAELWSPEDPFLYLAEIELTSGKQVLDTVSQPFGVREIATRNRKFYLNGQPYYLRGVGELSQEVITGSPSVSLEENRRRVGMARKYFNFMRVHSRIPPEEFFQAADELGLLLSAEFPVFHSPGLLPHLDYIFTELPEVYRAFRNHPSWISSALGNELDPLPGKEQEFQRAFRRFYKEAKELHPDHLVMPTDGFAFLPADYFATLAGYPLDPQIPVIAHEWGGWYCSLPDISLVSRFSGVVDPYWLRETEGWLRNNGLLEIYPEILKNSQRLQSLAHRFRVEKLRNNPDIQGYQIPSGITDFVSGTREGELWEEGVLNFFWEPKYGVTEAWSLLNQSTLLITDSDISERTWWQGKMAKVSVNVSHYGPRSLRNADLHYRLEHHGNVLLEQVVSNLSVAQGNVVRLADLEINVPELGEAAALTFRVELRDQTERIAHNEWTFWAYPQVRLSNPPIPVISRIADTKVGEFYPFIKHEKTAKPGDVMILHTVDHDSFQMIAQGTRALILVQPNRTGGQRVYDFFPTYDRDPHANGTRVEQHPLFRNFPNDGFCDAQFYNLMEGAMSLDAGSPPIMSTVKPLLWSLSSLGVYHPKDQGMGPNLHKLGFIYEFRVGKGQVLLVSLNFSRTFDEGYPSALYFFDQLLRYVTSSEFKPQDEMPEDQFTQFLHWVRP
jgi:beta-galactosidase